VAFIFFNFFNRKKLKKITITVIYQKETQIMDFTIDRNTIQSVVQIFCHAIETIDESIISQWKFHFKDDVIKKKISFKGIKKQITLYAG